MAEILKRTELEDFAKKAIPALWRDQLTREIKMEPLIIKGCNGAFPWCFSEAYIQYNKENPPAFEFKTWYEYAYENLIKVLRNKQGIQTEDIPSYITLINFVLKGEDLPCLQTLVNGKKISELHVAAILAIHYFKKLVPDGDYVVDQGYQDSKDPRNQKCPSKLCGERFRYGDTSIGNKIVWYGKADIILQKNIVKVNLEEDIDNDNLTESDSGDDSNTAELIYDHEEKNSHQVKKSKKSQFLAQTIVNGFFVSKQKDAHHEFIPSFSVTERHIRIALYNVNKDILLLSTKMPIWENDDKTLNLVTVINVWLALNYSHTVEQKKVSTYNLLKYTSTSQFKKLVSVENAYSIYLNDLQQPTSQTGKPSRLPSICDCFPDSDCFPDKLSVEKAEAEVALIDCSNKLFTG